MLKLVFSLRVSLALMVFVLGQAPFTANARGKKVIVSGAADIKDGAEAAARDAAIRNALKTAIEQVLGTLIESEFTAEQKEVLRPGQEDSEFSSAVADKLLTKTKGFVETQKILKEKKVGRTFRVTMEVVVSDSSLKDELVSLEKLLAAAGFPKVMVLTTEQYTNRSGQTAWLSSTGAARAIEEGLLKHNLELVAKDRALAMQAGDAGSLVQLLRSPSKAAAVAANAGADVTIIAITKSSFNSHNDFGANMYYVGATIELQAVQGGSGRVLASFATTGRGTGVSETDARQDAVKRAAPKVVESLIESLIRAWKNELKRGPLRVVSNQPRITVKERRETEGYQKLTSGDVLVLEAKGPMTVQFAVRGLQKRRTKKRVTATVEVARNALHLTTWNVELKPANKRTKVQEEKLVPTAQEAGQLAVPSGTHRLVLRFSGDKLDGLAVRLTRAAKVDALTALPEAVRSDGLSWATPQVQVQVPAPTFVEPDPEEVAPPLVTEPSPAPARTSTTPAAASTPGSSIQPAAAAPTRQPVSIADADGSVAGATRALADAVAKGFSQTGRGGLFHRVAIPYFEERGDAVKENNLGKIVPELLTVELAGREPFVVVERERLGQIMREHRLQGLGIVDEAHAAEFGRIMGAQSIISGTVSEAGPAFIVTTRQVEVETGQVLVSGTVEIARDGLIALSSDLVVKRSVMGAAVRSALVPGWGQVYNDQPLKGYALLGLGLITAGTAAAYSFLRFQSGQDYNNKKEGSIMPQKLERIRLDGDDYATRATQAWWVYGAVWAVAVVDALLNGKNYEGVNTEALASGTALQLHF